MQVARPPGGFRVVVSQEVQAYINSEIAANFRVEQFWHDILDRIKITALREGTPLQSSGVPKFTFVADGSPDFAIPTIQIVYECFADTLTIGAALVYQASDYEDDAE